MNKSKQIIGCFVLMLSRVVLLLSHVVPVLSRVVLMLSCDVSCFLVLSRVATRVAF